VDWPPINGWPFFETPGGLAPDGQGGVFLLATSRGFWLSKTGGSYALRHISEAGVVGAPLDFMPPIVDAGVLGPNPQAAVVPSGPGHCVVLWGWHQGGPSLFAQRFDTSLNGTWGAHPRLVSNETYWPLATSNLVAEPDGNGGAVAAWWTMDPNGTGFPSSAARAGWVRKNGTLGWSGGVTFAPTALPNPPASWLQIVPGASTGQATLVVPETLSAGTTFSAYAIDTSGNVSAPTALAGPVPDADVSFLRTRAAVTDGKGGLFFGYVDATLSLRVLRFRPPSTVAWDISLGSVANLRAFQLREDDSGGVLAAWVSAGSGSVGPRVELRRLSPTGAVTWDINAASAFTPLEVFVPRSSRTWLPDDWASLAQAVPDGHGGAILVFEDFSLPSRIAKLFSVCFDSSGEQQGNIEEVSGRNGPQTLSRITAVTQGSAAIAPGNAVIAWSDQGPGITGSQVWANRSGCCPPIGLPFPAPIPCEIASLDGSGFGDIPFWLPCGDDGAQYGLMPLMRLAKVGVNLPGCVVNRASSAPDWMRLSFRGLPTGTSIEVRSAKGKVLAKSRSSPLGVSLTFAPLAGPHDQFLLFRHRGARRDATPVPVQVEGSWGDGKPPAIVTRRARMSSKARRKSRSGRSPSKVSRVRAKKK